MKRSFATLDEYTLPLEYHYIIKAVERVQKRATRMMPSLKNLPYRKRLEILNLPSFSYRRKRGDMIIGLDKFVSLSNFKTRGHVFQTS